ncbi:MAG: di-heme oxidoredictase family protein [Phycisphaerales bacterium]
MHAPLRSRSDAVLPSSESTRRSRFVAATSTAATILFGATASASCPGDLDHSGVIDGGDLGMALLAWGTDDPAADLDGDGVVGGSDFGLLLIAWGPCPCDEAIELEPLHDESTPQEPEILFETADALVTRLADRARDRHAREDVVNGVVFRKYDHWLPFYWEQRIAEIEIVDRVARGGVGVTFNFMTHDRLDPAEFRTFFADTDSVALYHNNMSDLPGQGVSLVAEVPSARYPGETEYHYTASVERRFPDQAMLAVGDRIEVELSQFLLAPRNGRSNYYGTAFLYVVGEGVVPWYAKHKEEATTPEAYANASFDSYPVPEAARLGGLTTLPYQYSNEPRHRFKQLAGNISPASGHEFVLGRRLHHTDFRTGGHSEPGNPALDELAGLAGPTFVNTSCVACHVENGRSLPPEVGQPLDRAVVRVAAAASGTPHPLWGEELQHHSIDGGDELRHVEAEDFTAMSGVQTEACADVGGGLNVGFIDAGDWMAYGNAPVTIAEGGPHVVEFRVASAVGGGSIRFEEMGGGTLHATVAVPNTGGWQTWQTISATVDLAAGEHRFGLNAAAGGWNLNWFRVRSAGSDTASEPTPILAGWEETPGTYADGTPYSLRRPIYGFEGETPEFFSVRMAPPLIGLGLLEAVDEQTVIDLADECDLDGDGISGRVRTVESPLVATAQRLGRFTFKSGRDSIRHQIAYALNRDMGVTTTLEPMLDGATSPEAPELDDESLDRMTRYVALLGVGARRGLTDPVALHGETLFAAANCSACHVPELSTGSHHPYAELRNQTIRPFTDLLLHDLGPGLADPMAEDGVLGSEWRTAPLWNIGLTEGVADGEAYLHDGRARSLEEAILWHGGEAEASKEAFRQMSAADRAALIAFLKSL